MSAASNIQRNSSWSDLASKALEHGQSCWSTSCVPGELQNKVQAATRSIVGIASICLCPEVAVVSAVAGAINPEFTSKTCKVIDGLVSGFWNSLSYKQKMVASAVGIPTAYFVGLGLEIPAALFAAKLGAELTVRNYGKEEVAAKVREIEQPTEQ